MTYDEWYARSYNFYDLLSAEQKQSSLELKGPCFPVLMKTTNQYDVCQPYGEQKMRTPRPYYQANRADFLLSLSLFFLKS